MAASAFHYIDGFLCVCAAIGERVPGPSQIWETDSWTVYHKLDRTFGKPKVYAVFEVQ